jgi:serine/threonine-protein kinase
MTASGAVFGTPYYVSPEQAQSARAATAQSDLWSVAVLAYECLTGRRPFEAQSLMGLCLALNSGRFAPATSVRPELPAAIDAWFTRAFKHDPAARFVSASELAVTLAAALSETERATGAGNGTALVPSRTTWSQTLGGVRAARRAWRPVALVVGATAVIGWLLAQRIAPAPTTSPSPSMALAVEGTPVPTSSPPTASETSAAVTASSGPAILSGAPGIAAPQPRPPARPAGARQRPSTPSAASSDDLFNDPKH